MYHAKSQVTHNFWVVVLKTENVCLHHEVHKEETNLSWVIAAQIIMSDENHKIVKFFILSVSDKL